ncbi:MAG: helix-turn-helix transcriptional regulator [Clostridia bacterium]|nr:helix-turn-helix transcriptional regulator [Clostridia bacterium]
MDTTVIGARLKEIRLQKGMIQRDFAALLGMKRDAYARYEINGSVPTVQRLYTIAKTLGVSADYILGLTDEEH